MKATNFIKLSFVAVTVVLLSACGSSGGSNPAPVPDPTPTPTPVPTVITHNGTEYDTVTSPFTGKVWLDRNLGAARACIAFNDTACYGDYYQWGRNFDGHQDSLSGTTATLALDVGNAGSSDFIIGSPDWAPGPDLSGALRFANWSKSDGSSVCPVGFRVPTITELKDETIDAAAAVTNNTDAFNNFLKVPSAGGRDATTGVMGAEGVMGLMWTSTTAGIGAQAIRFHSASATIVPTNLRAVGVSVRCIQN